jgi:hypothetical protein
MKGGGISGLVEIIDFRMNVMPIEAMLRYRYVLQYCSRYSDQATGWTVRSSNSGSDERFFSSQKHPRPAVELTRA